MEDGYSTHIIEYGYEGGRWTIHVSARSFEEAMDRIRIAAAWGECIGSHAQEAPVQLGWWVRLTVWWRNLKRPRN